jgi:HK97 family phage major capsid protein
MGLKEQMGHELKSARDIAAKAEAENRDMTADEVATASTHLKAYNDFKAQLDASAGSQSVKDALAALGSELGLERNGDRPAPNEFRSTSKFQTLGQMFVESDAYKGLMSQFGTGTIGEKARVQSDPVGFKRLFARRGEKALVTGASDTSGGAFVQTDVQPDVELLGRRPLTIRDLVSVRQTDSDTVEFVQQTTQASSAAPVAEATSAAAPTTGASSGAALTLNPGGGYKPEGTIAYQKVTATVKTIAEWIPATKRGLADASQLRGLIDQELRDDLAEEEEDQILNGNGTGENITGILATSGIQAQAYAATVTDLDPLIETDWEKIQLARLAKNPNNEAITGAVPTLHGVPVVESEAIAAGVGLVGDFRKAVIWDREQASITATDSHADFFIRNLVAILAEERLAFGVLRPKAFVSIDLTA